MRAPTLLRRVGPGTFLRPIARFAISLLLGLLPAALVAGVAIDDTREEVTAALGVPLAESTAGRKEILTFAGGVEIELTNGRVTRAFKYTLEPPRPRPPERTAQAATPAPAPKPPPNEGDHPLGLETPRGPDLSLVEKLSREIEETTAAQPVAAAPDAPLSPTRVAIDAAIGFVLSWLVILAAFRLVGVSSGHGAILLIALADTLVHVGLPLAALHHWGFAGFWFIFHGIGFFVIIPLIQRLSDNRDWLVAIRAALVIRVGYLISTIAVHAIVFGIAFEKAAKAA